MTTHKTQYRTLWISDVHLGMRWCQAEFLLDFLKHHECETLYLVGDIIDGWQLKRSWRWPDSHKQVLLALREKIQNGTKVYYVPGNHDVFLRYSPNAVGTASNELFHQVLHNFFQKDLAGFIIQREIVHETIDGRKLLVLHGDEFDNLGQCADLLETIGNIAYARMLELNWCFNKIRQRLGLRYWSMSAWLKHRVKSAINFIKDYESSMAAEARRRGLDGIVCGHIHRAEIRQIDDILYCNDGDWVESCTALVEDWDGELSILHWTDTPMQTEEVHIRPPQIQQLST